MMPASSSCWGLPKILSWGTVSLQSLPPSSMASSLCPKSWWFHLEIHNGSHLRRLFLNKVILKFPVDMNFFFLIYPPLVCEIHMRKIRSWEKLDHSYYSWQSMTVECSILKIHHLWVCFAFFLEDTLSTQLIAFFRIVSKCMKIVRNHYFSSK